MLQMWLPECWIPMSSEYAADWLEYISQKVYWITQVVRKRGTKTELKSPIDQVYRESTAKQVNGNSGHIWGGTMGISGEVNTKV